MSEALTRAQTLMNYLKNYGNGDAETALNAAVRASSSFSSTADMLQSMLIERHFMEMHGFSTEFFLDYSCGINLNNDDTGAISGADAGGTTIKTATSVVDETGLTNASPASSTSTITSNGGNVTVVWNNTSNTLSPYGRYHSTAAANRTEVVAALNGSWLTAGLNTIYEAFGLGFGTTGSSQTLAVNFYNNDESVLAYVSTPSLGTYRSMFINENYTSMISEYTDGKIEGYDYYYDRIIAHELTHAVMGANIGTFINMPTWFKEGAAEVVHGIDDERRDTILSVASSSSALNVARDAENSVDVYAAGYIALRYLFKNGNSPAAGSNFFETSLLHYSDDVSTLVMENGGEQNIWLDGSSGTVYASPIQNINAAATTGNVRLSGTASDNVIISGNGTDTLWGGNGGSDTLVGGANTDIFLVDGSLGHDVITGGDSADRLIFTAQVDFTGINFTNGNLRADMGDGRSITVNGWSENALNDFELVDGSRWRLTDNGGGNVGIYGV